MSRARRKLLVVSIGNPGHLHNTRHSAGHHALDSLIKLLHKNAPWENVRYRGGCKGAVSSGHEHTLARSNEFMNVSGRFVNAVWKDTRFFKPPQPPPGLVLVHDELEQDLGKVTVRSWKSSHRGHNGVKSVQGAIDCNAYKSSGFWRIAVGIGRPEGRDPETVSEYVLARLTEKEQKILQNVGQDMQSLLEGIEADWHKKLAQSEGSDGT